MYPAALDEVRRELATAKDECRHIAATHRQLLMRYSAIKFMIDRSFKRIDEARHLEFGECWLEFFLLNNNIIETSFFKRDHPRGGFSENDKTLVRAVVGNTIVFFRLLFGILLYEIGI